MNLRNFNLSTSEENLIDACSKIDQTKLPSEGKQLLLTYLINLLILKQQQKLIKDQNEFNSKLLNNNQELITHSKSLVKATWVLAGVTAVLAIITIFTA